MGPYLSRKKFSMNRTVFFTCVRASLFGGSLQQSQVDGLNALLDYAETRTTAIDLRQVAYIFSTAYHETARTMEPIAEYGCGAGHEYGQPDPETGECYYGRGYVQLTWKDNYAHQGDKCGMPFVEEPDLVMEMTHAAHILFEGMLDGDFTGVSVGDYINETQCDYVNARRVVNGTDCADQIAAYALHFQEALLQATAPTV